MFIESAVGQVIFFCKRAWRSILGILSLRDLTLHRKLREPLQTLSSRLSQTEGDDRRAVPEPHRPSARSSIGRGAGIRLRSRTAQRRPAPPTPIVDWLTAKARQKP